MPSIASLIVRVGAQTQEFDKALADVGAKARAVGEDVRKIGAAGIPTTAQKSLESLRSTMDQITQAQQRVAERASLAAQGIEAIGGASRLTDTQLKQVNRTLQEGLSAYKALGQEPTAALQRVADETKNITTKTEGLKDSLKTIAAAFGAAFTVQAVIGFGRDLLRLADDIVRTADRTGLLTTEVQKLDFIASQSGNSLDELTGAIGQMQNRLSSGDDSALAALKRLNINLSDLQNEGPFQQLERIAKAIAAIESPANRAQAAIDLFGRTGVAILPTLISNFEQLGDAAPVMADKTVRAIEKAGDSLDQFQKQMKVWAAESYNLFGRLFDQFSGFVLRMTSRLFDGVADVLSVVTKIGSNLKTFGDFFSNSSIPGFQGLGLLAQGAGSALSFDGLTKGIDDLRERAQFARDAARQLAQITEDAGESAQKAAPGFNLITDATDKAGSAAKKAKREYEDFQRTLANAEFAREINALGGKAAPSFSADFIGPIESLTGRTIGTGAALSGPGVVNLTGGRTLPGGLGQGPAKIGPKTFDTGPIPSVVADLFGSVPGAIQAAIQGGGSKLQAAGSAIGQTIFGKDSSLTKTITGGIQSLFGSNGVLTKTLSSAIPIIGSLIGPAIAGIQKLFGKSEESAKVSPLRDEFFKAAGGLDVLNPKVLALTGNLKAVEDVFKAKTVDDYNAAVERLNKILAEGRAKFDALKEGVSNVGARLSAITTLTPDLKSALDSALDAKTPDDFREALGRINTELDKQKGKFDTIQTTLDKYGLSFTQAGEAFKQQRINLDADGLITDFNTLKDAGVDITAAIKGMGGSLSTFAQNAKDAGVEVPEAMKPILQAAIDAGVLFDKDGKPIKDLTALGLTFGSTMETVMKKTIPDAIDRLTVVLSGLAKFLGIDLPAAAESGAGKVQGELDGITPPDLTVRVHTELDPDSPDYNGGWNWNPDDPNGLPGYKRGSDGVKDFGAGTLAVLHGREAVIPEADLLSMNRAAQAQTSASAAAATPQVIQVVNHFHGSVLAATEYIEQHVVKPVLSGIARYNRAEFARLVAATP